MSDGLPALTPFSTVLERRSCSKGRVTFDITPDWLQGRTAFGGLTTALCVQSMRDVAGADWPLRSLQTSFIAPVNGRCVIDVQLLRQGRNVRQVQATVHSAGAVGAVVLGVFGVARQTVVPTLRPTMPAATTSFEELADTPSFGPPFLQHFRRRWESAEIPFSGANNWSSKIWISPRDTDIDAELATVMLADIPPSPALTFLTEMSASSSVSWELELLPVVTPFAADGYHRVDTDVIAAAEGFVSQRSTLWTPDRQLAALGYQVVGIYG